MYTNFAQLASSANSCYFSTMRPFDDDCRDKMQRIQANDPMLTEAVLHNVSHDTILNMAKALDTNTHLKTLSIGNWEMAHIPAMSQLLASLVANKHLIKLHTYNESCANICVIEEDLAKNNPPITLAELDLWHPGVYDLTEFAQGLATNTTLIQLRLGSCLTSARALGPALEQNTTLSVLDLYCNKITDIGPLAIALKTNTTLTELLLTRNDIENIDALAAALENNTSLRALALDSNSIVNIGAFAALAQNKSLTTLDLSNNLIVSIASLVTVLTANDTLRYLDLRSNRIADIAPFAEALKLNTTLCWVTLFGNELTDTVPMERDTALVIDETLTASSQTVFYDTVSRNKLIMSKYGIAASLERNKKLSSVKPTCLALTMAMRRQHTRLPPDLWDLFVHQFI